MSHFRTLELSDPAIDSRELRFATAKSPALGQRADLCLWVSPGAELLPRAPLVVLLHGVYGSHWAWALKGAAHLTAARLVREGALPPIVLAMPSDGLWGDGSGYVRHQRQDFERWLIEDVPHAAAEATGLCDPEAPVYFAGLSMGGHAALRLAGKYPRRVAAAAAHSAVTDAETLGQLILESQDGWSACPQDNSIEAALTASEAPLPPLWIGCGIDDPYLEDNRRLRDTLARRDIAHLYHESAGGHDWDHWTREVENSLRFFGTVMAYD